MSTSRFVLALAALLALSTLLVNPGPVRSDASEAARSTLADQPGDVGIDASAPQPAPYLAALDDLPLQAVDVGGTVEAENACYARLPDLPAPRYGGFGAYNPQTGVLAYTGGARKFGIENTFAYFQQFAIKLDGTMDSWNEIRYPQGVGFTQAEDKGCREAASVMVSDPTDPEARWVSVMGKDGCDNGAFDTKSKKGGDIKELVVGATADGRGVRWTRNSGLVELPQELEGSGGRLHRLFATWDHQRSRLVLGQGTFDNEHDATTQHEVYFAHRVGSQWRMEQAFTSGAHPPRRYSSCASYVYQEDTGVDGVLVMGGHTGAPLSSTFKEVWWLDFSERAQGSWIELTDRFDNMDAFGPRRAGACAYDGQTQTFYSWMGRASADIPDGAKRSAGAWRVDLSALGDVLSDPNATLSWERLAKDDLQGVNGRRFVPSVYDPVNKRFFAIGGRNDLEAYRTVWAIYPDVTGQDCADLDPYEPFAGAVPTPAPTRTTAPPDAQVCEFARNRVPPAALQAALANPQSVQGYNQPVDPGKPAGPRNPLQTWLSVQNIGVPYHPIFNPLAYKAGCP